MTLLILGVLLFAVVHFIPLLTPSLKQRWAGCLGAVGYRVSFSLVVVGSIALMVVGWRCADAIGVYAPIAAIKTPALVLMLVSIVLMVVARRNSILRRLIRHPQLIGLLLWSIAHLLINGDSRSLVLFGGLGLWAIIEIMLINKRDGQWIKSAAPTWGAECLTLLIACAVFALLVLVHPYVAGVPVA